MHVLGPYETHWALPHIFHIIAHCTMSNSYYSRSYPMDFYCHSNSLYWWAITFERTSLFNTTLKVYYKMDGAHLLLKQGHLMLRASLEWGLYILLCFAQSALDT